MNAMMIIEALKKQGVTTQSLCLDSRRVQRGDVFVAVSGAHTDGRKFIDDAVKRGATAVLFDAAGRASSINVPNVAVPDLAAALGDIAHLVYGRPSETLQVIGITGTNGKTSVSQWISQALSCLDKPCAVIGTLGNGFPGQLNESSNTTPDAIAVHSGLANYLSQGAKACAMEVSSIGLDQGRVNGVAFDTAVFTNLSRDHLDYHGDMDAYAAAKAKLFEMRGLKTAVINLDDPFGVELARMLRGKVHTLGFTLKHARGTDNVLAGFCLNVDGAGLSFVLDGFDVEAKMIGRFNASNLLAVIGALIAADVSLEDAIDSVANLSPPPGRLQSIGGTKIPLVVVDYAHTPDALDKALTALREVAATRNGKLICVFGCGGDRDAGKRPMMGAMAERLADQVIVTSDNPRSEDPDVIAAQIVGGMESKPSMELDRERAINKAIAAADIHDVVLIAGKGHEAYQEIAGTKHSFSDLDVAKQALESRS